MSAPCTSLRHKKTFKSRVVQVVSLDCPWRKTPLTSDLADWETGLSQRVKASGIQSSTENTAQTAHTDRYGTEVSKADTPVGESDKYSKLILRLIMWQIISIIFCSSELNVILLICDPVDLMTLLFRKHRLSFKVIWESEKEIVDYYQVGHSLKA